jgi:GxxExxY protein
MSENEISKIIVEAAFELHTKIGPGLLEKVYTECLAHLLIKKGMMLEKEKSIPFIFDGIQFDTAFRLDLIVQNKVIVEVKSVSEIADVHMAQLITYLKITNLKLGLIINFNVPLIKNGIRRVANGMPY